MEGGTQYCPTKSEQPVAVLIRVRLPSSSLPTRTAPLTQEHARVCGCRLTVAWEAGSKVGAAWGLWGEGLVRGPERPLRESVLHPTAATVYAAPNCMWSAREMVHAA